MELRLNPQILLDLALGADRRWVEAQLRDRTDIVLSIPVQMQRRGQELKLCRIKLIP
jgi:hypothetical protein